MADIKHVIEPERFGIWIAVTFVIALLALIVALGAVKQANEVTAITQAEILLLNQKITGAQPAAPAPAEPAAAAE
jgi:Tfp pilus assembly protein PilN